MQKQSGLKNPSPFNPLKMNHMLGGNGITLPGLSKEALKQLEIAFLYQTGVIQFQFGQVGDIPMFADFFNEGISCVVDSTVTTLVIH